MTAFQLIQSIYWLALSTWFGSVLSIALIVPVIYKAIRDANPILPTVLAVNLENQHATLLASNVVAAIMKLLSNLQIVCASVVLAAFIAQIFVTDRSGYYQVAAIIRGACYLAAIGLLLYHRLAIWPRATEHRQTYLDNADDPDVANPAKEQMDHYDSESVRLLMFTLAALSMLVAFSSVISPRAITISMGGGQ